MGDTNAILNLQEITKSYPGNEATPVLKNVALSVAPGEAIAIIGPSGCGKSTLLNLIGTLDTPDSGTLTFEGSPLQGLNEAEQAHFRNTAIGFIFQAHHLLPQCTVLENILMPTLMQDSEEDFKERAMHLLEAVGLADRADAMPGQLSGGECQRVAVVRALINRPKLLLADEPTGSLSQSGAESLTQLLLQLNQQEKLALILVTHSLHVAKQMDKIYHLLDGVLTPYTGEEV